jgi:hypothetical protein
VVFFPQKTNGIIITVLQISVTSQKRIEIFGGPEFQIAQTGKILGEPRPDCCFLIYNKSKNRESEIAFAFYLSVLYLSV